MGFTAISLHRLGGVRSKGKLSSRMKGQYVPRKCSATKKLVPAYESGAIQISVGLTNDQGLYNGEAYSFVISGAVRSRGESDTALNHLFHEKGVLSFDH